MKTHPFENMPSGRFRWCFWSLFGATLVLMGLLWALGKPLQQTRIPGGGACDIVAFEFAKTPEHAGEIVEAWRANGVLSNAKWNTWLDFLFLLCYPNLVALGIAALLSLPMSNLWETIGRLLAWAQWLVLLCDATENAALLRILYGAAATPWPQLAFVCAAFKFGLLAAGVAYLGVTFVRRQMVL